MFGKLAVVMVATAMAVMPAQAQQSWQQRQLQVVACEEIRNTTLTAVDQWNGKLWFASTDNARTGWLNPNVVIEARQRVQEMVQAYDWKYTARIRSTDTVSSEVCRTHALESATQIGEFIERTLRTR